MQVKKQVNLVVKLCVAQFVAGMLTLPDKLSKIISTSVGRSCPTLMNLKHIATHQQLTDVKFTLNNQGCFNLLVDGLNKNQHLLQNVRALSLSNNEIASLKPLSKLVGLNLHTLDLQYNKINSFDEFVHLEHLNLHEVILIGNSITNVPMFKEKIKNILPTLKKVDSTDVKPSTSADNRSEPIRLFKDNDIKIRAVDVNDYLKKTFAQHDSKLWNRVTVTHKGKVTKKNILVHVNRQLFKRTLFIPCYYESGPKIDIFYLHDNFEALNALVQNNLAMTIPTIDTEFKFELHLKCADWIDGHVNWRNKINFAVKKRLKGSKLNLDDFSEDSDLNDNLIVTMSSIAVLRHVLKTALELNRNIVTMTVRDNKITTVEGFQFLKNFPELKSLDLSKNYIESFETLPCLPTVVEVLVGGNPLCTEFYNAPWRYIEKMMRFFPNLQYIDGLRIEKSFIPIVTLQNYLVSPSAYCLSETFVKRFFKIYDSRSRTSLAEFYDNNAIFSVSVNFPQMNNAFNGKSRNLLQNMRNIENEVFVGNRNIVDFFESLPDSQHDFPTMCIDVPMMSEKNILITINGFFKEQGESLNAGDVYFKFTRTFNLERLNPVFETFRNTFRFMIKNDLLQVQQIRVDESLKAFKKNVIQKDEIKKVCWDLTPNIPQARSASTLILKELTKLKTSFCQRFVESFNSIPFLTSFFLQTSWRYWLGFRSCPPTFSCLDWSKLFLGRWF